MTCSRSHQNPATCTFTFNQPPRGPGLLVGLSSHSTMSFYSVANRNWKAADRKRGMNAILRRLNSDEEKKGFNTFASQSVNLWQVVLQRRTGCAFVPPHDLKTKSRCSFITSLLLTHYSTCQNHLRERRSAFTFSPQSKNKSVSVADSEHKQLIQSFPHGFRSWISFWSKTASVYLFSVTLVLRFGLG